MSIPYGVRGVAWDYCDRCQLKHYIADLEVQKGRKLCRCHGCVDDLDIEFRPLIIAEVLGEGDEFGNESAESLQRTPGDTPTF